LSEEKIARLRDVFIKVTAEFIVEQELPKNFDELPENEQIGAFSVNVVKMDSLLYEMCKLGIDGAKVRGVSSEEIERFMKELEETSKELRDNTIRKNIPKAMFLVSQFQLLQRRIISSVANMLSPNPLYEFSKMASKPIVSKNVFIVHGNDHEPMKELKSMLFELGLNPIVLHEQVSGGSSTLAEKLEEYANNVGYAFVILTPDDIGGQRAIMQKKLVKDTSWLPVPRPLIVTVGLVDEILNCFEPRARQNVIFEMGYFWGMLQRKRVCCLLKGIVQKPSDIEGVVYIHFENSIDKEIRLEIMKVLKKAGYEIRF
jgi:predicted nucleotide-binding protein